MRTITAIILLLLTFNLHLTKVVAQPLPPDAVPKELKTPRFQVRRVIESDEKDDFVALPQRDEVAHRDEWLFGKEIILDGKDVGFAVVLTAKDGKKAVGFSLTQDASARFSRYTEANVGKRIAILFDGAVLIAPTIHEKISNGRMVIDRGGKEEELAKVLNGEATARVDAEIAAKRGPPQWETGPIVDAEIHDIVEGGKGCCISFSSGRLSDRPMSPPQSKPGEYALSSWAAQMGIDALGFTGKPMRGLEGLDMVVLPTLDSTWDQPPDSTVSFLSMLKPGTLTAISGNGSLPETYLIKNRIGSMGILQILELNDGSPKSVKIRYKMFHRIATTKSAPNPSPG